MLDHVVISDSQHVHQPKSTYENGQSSQINLLDLPRYRVDQNHIHMHIECDALSRFTLDSNELKSI